MEDFRPETFTQYVFKRKPLWMAKMLWLGVSLFLFITFILTYKTNLDTFWVYFVFAIGGVLLQTFFLYSMSYKIYALGRKAFVELDNQNLTFLNDVGVLIRSFDLASKKSFFDINITKTIYQFDKADLIICASSIVLIGKGNAKEGFWFAAPVEIRTTKKLTTIAGAQLINWEEKGERTVLEIKDDYYSKPFKIEFKSHNVEIRNWLANLQDIS